MTLVRSISGVRGTTGVEITEELVARYSRAFAQMVGGQIVVGADGRRGGARLREVVLDALGRGGALPLDAGVVPTPTVGIAVRERGLSGGIVVTASHNPESQNGLKFFSSNGVFLVEEEVERLFLLADGAADDGGGTPSEPRRLEGLVRRHIDLVLGSEFVDADGIRSARPKVVVDCVNGAGSVALPELLLDLGCAVRTMNGEPGAGFARGPEPVPGNLRVLSEAVVEHGAQLGVACDPDADRLALVDEHGRPVGEEYTLVLAARSVLRRKPGPIVANVSTSRMVDDLAGEFGVAVHRSAVGEINVVTKMEEVTAVVGGEGNGGVILPQVHRGRDACTAAALALTALVNEGVSLSQIVSSMPSYAMVKTKLETSGLSRESLREAVAEAFPGAGRDFTDGAKMTWPDMWVHARMSGTEPVVRLIAEAPDRAKALELIEKASEVLSRLMEGGLSCAE